MSFVFVEEVLSGPEEASNLGWSGRKEGGSWKMYLAQPPPPLFLELLSPKACAPQRPLPHKVGSELPAFLLIGKKLHYLNYVATPTFELTTCAGVSRIKRSSLYAGFFPPSFASRQFLHNDDWPIASPRRGRRRRRSSIWTLSLGPISIPKSCQKPR